MQKGMAEVNGTNLYYEFTGEGPTLVLAHANPANLTMWDEQVATLSQHYRVLRYDQRGAGQSERASGTFSHHEDLNGLLAFLGVSEAHVVGLSNGAMLVTDFALAHPEKVLSLVLASPALGGYEFTGEPPPTLLALFGALGTGAMDEATELATQIWADGPSRSPEDVDAAFRERFEAMARAELKVMLPDAVQPEGLEPPAIDRLAEISAPTLVIVGDKDDPSIMDIGDTLANRIAGAERVVIRGAAHMLNMEKPEVFSRTVLDFLGRVQDVS